MRARTTPAADTGPLRPFRFLLVAQWGLGVGLVLWLAPFGEAIRHAQPHGLALLLVAGLVNLAPLWLARREVHGMVDTAARLAESHVQAEKEVARRNAELTKSADRFHALIESTNALPWQLSLETRALVYESPRAARFFGSKDQTACEEGFLTSFVHPKDAPILAKAIRSFVKGGFRQGEEVEYRMITPDQRILHARTFLYPGIERDVVHGMTFDITRHKKIESELHQAQKLEAVGRLSAGVAHEINTPVQFVSDSMYFVQDAAKDLLAMVDALQAVEARAKAGEPVSGAVAAAEVEERIDLERLREHVPRAVARALEGLDRVATIVRSMKHYAHPGGQGAAPANLVAAIESTLVIARNEYKYVAELETDLGELPPVTCQLGDINQVVLNLVVNASHAIEERVKGTGGMGKITVKARAAGEHVTLEIGDTGGGIPDAIASKVFDPFFTTKEVGRGTGQGLALAYATIVERHGGKLWFESEAGVGTTFFLQLPIDGVKK